jgi:hypothetical protein
MALDEEVRVERPEEPATLLEVVEKAGRQIGTGLVVGAAFVALAIYARPGPPRFQAVASGSDVVRIDTRSGAMISCTGGQCYSVRKPGDKTGKIPPPAPSAPPKAAVPALPPAAPAPAPAPPAPAR